MDTVIGLEENIQKIFEDLKTSSELHFQEYNNDKDIKKYYLALKSVIREPVMRMKIFILNNNDAQKAAKEMHLGMMDLRKLFYIKIPERLFYGMVRDIEPNSTIRIVVDKSDEYTTLDLYSKLKEQMNAHAAYRNKKYMVEAVGAEDSKKSISVQITDTLMGIVVFLLEKTYYEESDASKIKGDLIYRFLLDLETLSNFINKVVLFKWEGNDEQLIRISIGDYISEFFVYKTAFDLKEMMRLYKYMNENPVSNSKDLRLIMGYSNTRLRTLLGYKDEIEGKGRNWFLDI